MIKFKMFWFWCSESWKKVLYDWFVRCDGMIAMHYRSYVQNTLLDSLQVSYCIFQFQNCMKREQTNVWMYLSINASYFSSSIFMRRFLTSKLYGNASEQFLTSHSPIGCIKRKPIVTVIRNADCNHPSSNRQNLLLPTPSSIYIRISV